MYTEPLPSHVLRQAELVVAAAPQPSPQALAKVARLLALSATQSDEQAPALTEYQAAA